MAGILKSIQKKKSADASRRSDREGILTLVGNQESFGIATPEPTESYPVTADQLLGSLIEESDEVDNRNLSSADTKGSNQGSKVVRRHQVVKAEDRKIELKDNSLPDWVKPVSKLPANLETSYLETVKKINKEISELGLLPLLRDEIFKKAIAETNVNLTADTKLSWKDQDLIERELKNITSIDIHLGPLLLDEHTSEIFCDSHRSIKARRKGLLIETPFSFRNTEEYELFLSSIFSSVGKLLTPNTPVIECSLRAGPQSSTPWTGSIAHAVHSSLAADSEHHLTIKVPRLQSVSFYDLLQMKALPATVAAWLAECISQGEANIIVVGGKNSGKNLVTAALASEIGSHERAIIIEDIPEIQFSTANAEKFTAHSTSATLSPEANVAALIKNAVRRHPNRIIATNLRDKAAAEFLRALESGLTGSISSAQGEYPEDGLWRLFDEISLNDPSAKTSLLRRISRSFNIIISMGNYGSKPCLVEIAEIIPVDGDEFKVLPLVQLDSIIEGKRLWKITALDSFWLRKTSERGAELRTGPGVLPFGESSGE